MKSGLNGEAPSYVKEVENCVGLATATKIIAEIESSDEEDKSECRLALAALSNTLRAKLQNLQAAMHETYVTLSERALLRTKR